MLSSLRSRILTTMRRVLFGVLLALLLGACGGSVPDGDSITAAPPSTAESESAAPETTEVEEATPESEADAGPTPSDLVGRWAHFDVVAYENDAAFKSLIISYGFNDFAEVDGEIIDSASFCFSEQRTNQPISAGLSDAATQAIKPPSTPLDVEVVDGTLVIRRDATPTPVGIRLDDPATESLPADPDDPRIVDDDGDGNPGVTVSIDAGGGVTGELYIARLEIFSYEAQLTAPDLIEGTVVDESQQLQIGASSPLFLTADSEFLQVPDPELNPIMLVRVDPDWDCERLATERDALFPTTPEADW